MIVWLLLLVIVAWTVVFRYRRRNMYRLAATIPAPNYELPIIGIGHILSGDTEDILKCLQNLSYLAMENNGHARGWLGYILCIVVTNPADLEMVLKTCLEKDDLHRFIRKITGLGGIFAPVKIWRRRRKILVPAFSPKIVENFVEVFSEQSETLAKKLVKCEGVGNFSIWPFLSAYTLDSVCETAMGVKINAQENPDSLFLKSITRSLHLACERMFHLWLQPDWLYKLFRQSREYDRCIKLMHDFTDDVVRKKREEINSDNVSKTEVDHEYDLGTYKRKTFLDLLISLSGGEKGYSNEELREEVLTLAMAGTDTSAVAVSNTVILLGKYPEVQEKVYRELYEIFGDTDRPLKKEDLTKMKYLERVIKESLRLFPPAPFVMRKVLEDTTLPSGRIMPAGSGVIVSIWGAHRDPKYWGPEAEHFDPDRFLPERFNVHPCSYMPFSSGPRNCVVSVTNNSLVCIKKSFKYEEQSYAQFSALLILIDGEARKSSVIVHEIINGDFSLEINNEAMQLSVQLIHEKPTFSVLGLFDLNYSLLQQGARSVLTYLVMVLQFATENSQEKPP